MDVFEKLPWERDLNLTGVRTDAAARPKRKQEIHEEGRRGSTDDGTRLVNGRSCDRPKATEAGEQ
jgi:hypothetical protein